MRSFGHDFLEESSLPWSQTLRIKRVNFFQVFPRIFQGLYSSRQRFLGQIFSAPGIPSQNIFREQGFSVQNIFRVQGFPVQNIFRVQGFPAQNYI